MKDKKNWFRLKKYPHIGMPILEKDRNWVAKYVQDDEKVAQHSFLPFIHRTKLTRKFRKSYDDVSGAIQDDGRRTPSSKAREIFYASHLDSSIYAYYAETLGELYELELHNRGIETNVTAYRYIQHPVQRRGMNNVDFAEEVFSFVRQRNDSDLFAITFDIKSFFDNLSHRRLKEVWASLLKCDRLPAGHYAVFKAITDFAYVDFSELFKLTQHNLVAFNPEGKEERIAVADAKNLRNQGIVAFCSNTEFRTLVKPAGLVKSNKRVKQKNGEWILRVRGVPQGSPISATLANIYLLEFDKVEALVRGLGGLYRRYSDDIVVVVPSESAAVTDFVLGTIREFELEIQKEKTETYLFSTFVKGRDCRRKMPDGSFRTGKRLSYLGFEFDGQFTYLKSASLAKFYRRMKRAVRRGGFYARYSNYLQGRGQIFRRRLFNRFSYLGGRRKIKWILNSKTNEWQRVHQHDWGNFLTYAYMAHRNMADNKIRRQVRGHWMKLNTLIRLREARARGAE